MRRHFNRSKGRQDLCASGKSDPGKSRQDVCAPGETRGPSGTRAPNETYRVFIAIELPRDVRQRMEQHIDRLRKSVPEARAGWNREENLHLTLKFLGKVPFPRIEALSQAAGRAADTVKPFDLIVGGCGAFPPRGAPHVLWVGIEDPAGGLANLHQGLEDECQAAGFAREQRPFHPHLTIARLRKPQGSRRLAALHKEIDFDRAVFLASEIAVFRSELLSDGSKHTVISRHEFS